MLSMFGTFIALKFVFDILGAILALTVIITLLINMSKH